MTARRGLVLDANILLRAVFWTDRPADSGSLRGSANFYTADVCFEDARRCIPDLSHHRRIDVDLALFVLDQISRIVESVDRSLYEEYQEIARSRVLSRDPDDWPVAAVALLLGLPIWIEDQDFFGSGIPTWTNDRIELYFANSNNKIRLPRIEGIACSWYRTRARRSNPHYYCARRDS